MSNKKVAIVGAGFSGLTLAWALSKKNISVEIFEATDRVGGLLGSKGDGILVEQAANALLASENVEAMFKDIGVVPVTAGFRSKKRWIFRGRPKAMPLFPIEGLSGLMRLLSSKFSGSLKPNANETLAAWCKRVLNKSFNDYLISPAFQGVYGTSSESLSASLILGPLFNKELKSKKGELHGSISANGGMQEIIDGLTELLNTRGVVINRNSKIDLQELQSKFSSIVVATSLAAAPGLLKTLTPQTAEKLKKIPLLPLTSVTLKFSQTKRINGFGCLFPLSEKFHSLGVLFNSDIFPNRGDFSETWILSDITSNDSDLLKAVMKDRSRLVRNEEAPEKSFINRWDKALPLYGAELEKILSEKEFSSGLKNGVRLLEGQGPLYLTGNYLGVIGLAKILDYNLRLANRIEMELI